MGERVLTAPRAYIEVDGAVAGHIRNITWTETYQRVEIRGIGRLNALEVPVVSESNTFSLDNYFIDFSLEYVQKLLNRTGGAQALLRTITQGELPTSIVIFEKISVIDPNTKLATSLNRTGKEKVTLTDCYVDAQTWNLTEAGISTMNVNGRYLTPIALNP